MSRVRLWPDPVLQRPAEPVAAFDDALSELVADLLSEMYAANARGMAAPVLGVSKRVFVMDCDWKSGARAPRAFVNPTLVARSDTHLAAVEHCISLPGEPRSVLRPDAVEVAWFDCEAMPQRSWFSGASARMIQHDYDHLDGRLIIDYAAAV
ncbi:MAG: peptide deformylase [Pseudomonadota bacterium]